MTAGPSLEHCQGRRRRKFWSRECDTVKLFYGPQIAVNAQQ